MTIKIFSLSSAENGGKGKPKKMFEWHRKRTNGRFENHKHKDGQGAKHTIQILRDTQALWMCGTGIIAPAEFRFQSTVSL